MIRFPSLAAAILILGVATPVAAQVPPLSAEFLEAFDPAVAARQLSEAQREWAHYRELDQYGHGAVGDDGRLQDLRRQTARDQALAAPEPSSQDMLDACLSEALKSCSSHAGGWLRSHDGDRVLDFVSRAANCEHWGGEEGYDDDRRRQVEAAVIEQRCDALAAEATRRASAYADQPGTLALIRRVQPAITDTLHRLAKVIVLR